MIPKKLWNRKTAVRLKFFFQLVDVNIKHMNCAGYIYKKHTYKKQVILLIALKSAYEVKRVHAQTFSSHMHNYFQHYIHIRLLKCHLSNQQLSFVGPTVGFRIYLIFSFYENLEAESE